MLSSEELVLALINNLSEWDWYLFPKFSIDQDTAKALIKFYWEDYKKEGQIEGQMSFADLGLFDRVPVYTTTGCSRTGCVACGFGIQCDKRPNRFELIDRVSNPKLRDWIMRGGAFDDDGLWKPDNNGLGYWFVLQYLNVHGNMNIYIPEYERYEKEFGNEETRRYLKENRDVIS